MDRAGAIAGAAALTAVVGVAAVYLAKAIGRWFRRAIVDSVTEGVREITAPDLSALAHSLSESIDALAASIRAAIEDLTASNNAQHAAVDSRLGDVEERLAIVELRLIHVETRLNIRPPDARTRATDQQGES